MKISHDGRFSHDVGFYIWKISHILFMTDFFNELKVGHFLPLFVWFTRGYNFYLVGGLNADDLVMDANRGRDQCSFCDFDGTATFEYEDMSRCRPEDS